MSSGSYRRVPVSGRFEPVRTAERQQSTAGRGTAFAHREARAFASEVST